MSEHHEENWRVLLVDDDEEDYIITRTLLAQIPGRRVALDWAPTYQAGDQMLRTAPYQAALVDYRLGSHSGLEFIREQTGRGCPTALILYTGQGSFEIDVEAMEAGATLYLTKADAAPLLMLRLLRYAIERKQAELQLQRSLAEKEVLLRELYHRTLNNMQVILSLLQLEENHLNDPASRQVLEDMQQRIQVMAQVHEKLYQSNDLSRLDLGQYLRDLASNVFENQAVSGQVRLETEMDSIPALYDVAIPCGLVVNELATNAVRYAFPGGRAGTVRVWLHAAEGQRLRFGVADDGAGLPGGVDAQLGGRLGLKMVRLLVHYQLRGQLELEQGAAGGVQWEVAFENSLYQRRV